MDLFKRISGCCSFQQHEQSNFAVKPKLLSGNRVLSVTAKHPESTVGGSSHEREKLDTLTTVQRLLSAVAGGSEDAWLYRLDSATGLLREQFEADFACIYAVYEGGYTFTALSASGIAADGVQRAIPFSVHQDPSASIAVLLSTQQRFSTARSNTGAIRASAEPADPATSELPGALDRLPSDWHRLAAKHGLQHFIAVPCCSGGVVVGALTLASRRGPLPPACWHGGVVAAVGSAVVLLLQPRQVSLAVSVLGDVHLARNVDELVRAVRRGVQDLVVATTYLPPALRVALIRTDGSAAAIFEEQGQRKASYSRFSATSGGDLGVGVVGGGGVAEVLQPPAGSLRRSMDMSRHDLAVHGSLQPRQPHHGRERTMSALAACCQVANASTVPRLLQAPPCISAHANAMEVSDGGAGPESAPQVGAAASEAAFSRLSMPAQLGGSVPDRAFLAVTGLPLGGSFSMQGAGNAAAGGGAANGAAKGAARGHTLSLHNTLLGEALQKDAGLWISDCTLYLQEAKTFPRDIVVSRGSRAVHSIAVCGGRSGGCPLLGAYCVYGSVVPRQLLRAVTLELEQLLKLLAPSVAARLASPVLADEWRYLHDEVLDPARVDAKRPPRSSASVPNSDVGPCSGAAAGAAAGFGSPGGGGGARRPSAQQQPQHLVAGGPGSPAAGPRQRIGSGAGGVGSGAGGLALAHAGLGPPACRGGAAAGGAEPASPPATGSACANRPLPPGIFVANTSQDYDKEPASDAQDADPGAAAAAPAAAAPDGSPLWNGGSRASTVTHGSAQSHPSPSPAQQALALGCCNPSLADGLALGGEGLAAAVLQLPPRTPSAAVAIPIVSSVRDTRIAAFGAAADGPAPSAAGSQCLGSGAGGLEGPAAGASMAGSLEPAGSPSAGACGPSFSPAEALGLRFQDGSTGPTLGTGGTIGSGPSGSPGRALLAAPSFTVEAVRSNLGGGLRRAPLISGLHERLAAAQASRLVHGSAVEHQEELGAIEVHEKIGEGGYGEVYRGQYDGMEVAIKIVYEPNGAQSTILPRVGATAMNTTDETSPGTSVRARLCDAFELTVSVSVSHPHIVQVLTFFTDVYVHVERPTHTHSYTRSHDHGHGHDHGQPLSASICAGSRRPPQRSPSAGCGPPTLTLGPDSPRSSHPRHPCAPASASSGPPRVTLLPYPYPMASCQLTTIDVTAAQFADYTALQAAMASNGSAAMHAVGASPPAMVICMEYCDAGSLTDAIARGAFRLPSLGLYSTSQPNMKAIYATLLEVALALRHLHALRLVHCDLKPSNVLLRSAPRDPRGFTAKLSDFGLVRLMEPCGEGGRLAIPRGVHHGTVSHMAPEVLAQGNSVAHDASLDIYAFGIVMHQIVYGTRLYAGVDAADIPARVVRGCMRPRFISNVPSEYSHLAESCWAADPASRPTAGELVAALKKLMGLGQRQHGQRRHSALPPQLPNRDRPIGLPVDLSPALARLAREAADGSVAQAADSGLGLGLTARGAAESSYAGVMSFRAGLQGSDGVGSGGEARGEGAAVSGSRSRSGQVRTRSLSYGGFPVHIL